jgi:T-complex protein 1 subunit epsilon
MLLIEGEAKLLCVALLIRGGKNLMVAEAEGSIHDAVCVPRNLFWDDRIVYGGGNLCEKGGGKR